MIKVGIIGYGNLGKGVEKAVNAAADMELVAKKAADAVECYITEGADRAMNRFN